MLYFGLLFKITKFFILSVIIIIRENKKNQLRRLYSAMPNIWYPPPQLGQIKRFKIIKHEGNI